jgi:hypothetical protein
MDARVKPGHDGRGIRSRERGPNFAAIKDYIPTIPLMKGRF